MARKPDDLGSKTHGYSCDNLRYFWSPKCPKVEICLGPKFAQKLKYFSKSPKGYIWPKCVLIAAKSASNTPCGICEKHPNLWNIFGFKQIPQKYPTQVYFWIEYIYNIQHISNIPQRLRYVWSQTYSNRNISKSKISADVQAWCQMYSWMISRLFLRCEGVFLEMSGGYFWTISIGIFGDVKGCFWQISSGIFGDVKGYLYTHQATSTVQGEGSESSYW